MVSVGDVAVLSGSPFEDSKKSDVSVLSAVSEDETLVREVSSVLLVSDALLDEVEWDEDDEEESEPVGLFLPQPARSITAQKRTETAIKAKSFFIFILYILSETHGKIFTAQQKFFPFALFLCMEFLRIFIGVQVNASRCHSGTNGVSDRIP